MKLSACLIIRNEAANLERCLQSIRPHVDEICVLDTGSDDDSPAIAQRLADKFEAWTGCNDAEGRIVDFSAARNRNLAMATGDAVLWLDGDDELVGGEHLRKVASEAPRGPSGAFSVLAAYEYDQDSAGRCTTLQWRERIVGPPGQYEWRGPVHEGLLGKAGCDPANVQTDAFRVIHRRRQVGKAYDPERNLRILREWFAKHGEADARLMHYYGSELLLNRHIGEALYWFRRHIAVAPWSDERALSLMHIARVQLAFGDASAAAETALQATAVKSWPEPLWLLGQAFCVLAEQGIDPEYNVKRGSHFLERGMAIGAAPTLLMTDPTARYEALAWLSAARAKLGDLDGALTYAEEGLKGMPEHPEMRTNVKVWRGEKLRNQVRQGMVELHKLGEVTREAGVVVEATLRGEFKVERQNPNAGGHRLRMAEERAIPSERSPRLSLGDAHGREEGRGLRIAFYLGHQLEPWTPRTLEEQGMGGSETMAWEMSKRLAKLGHRVRVYAHQPDSAKHRKGIVYEGVRWHDEEHFDRVSCDLLISSRRFDAAHRCSYKAAVLWVHDVHVGEQFTPHDAAKFDLIWCLSQWHRDFFLQTYPWCPPGKVEVTRNGIDLDRFRRTDVKRNPHRAIYSSSPDRGLVTAVRAWPEVRMRVPDAELHCYYGFDNWERSLELGGENGIPWCSRAALAELKELIATTEGVVMHGRVNGNQLAEAMLGAGVWFYPTWFSETSCITAMEAQAAGLVCVCPPIAALAETVPSGGSRLVWSGELTEDVALAMTNPRMTRGAFRANNQAEADRFSLDTLATAWDKRLRALVDAVVPAFSEAAQ